MDIFIAVVIIALIGIVIGIGLSVASAFFAVPKNELEEKVRECLPGANCGACGYSGCDGYAAAIAKGDEDNISLCAPGGNKTAGEIAEVTGKTAQEVVPMAAVVMCNGTCDNSPKKLEYQGINSCKAASMMFGGQKSCIYGCLGYGDCVDVCESNAISICDGVARVDVSACVGCTLCAKTCPKGLIDVLPLDKAQAVVMCKNRDKGAFAIKNCSVSCIGCGKCQKSCEEGAVIVEGFCAHVDPHKCIGCGKCVDSCPRKCIKLAKLEK